MLVEDPLTGVTASPRKSLSPLWGVLAGYLLSSHSLHRTAKPRSQQQLRIRGNLTIAQTINSHTYCLVVCSTPSETFGREKSCFV